MKNELRSFHNDNHKTIIHFTFDSEIRRRVAKPDQAAAIDTSLVFSVLKQLPNDHLMFLVFSHPAIHFAKMLQKQLQIVVTRWTLTIP